MPVALTGAGGPPAAPAAPVARSAAGDSALAGALGPCAEDRQTAQTLPSGATPPGSSAGTIISERLRPQRSSLCSSERSTWTVPNILCLASFTPEGNGRAQLGPAATSRRSGASSELDVAGSPPPG